MMKTILVVAIMAMFVAPALAAEATPATAAAALAAAEAAADAATAAAVAAKAAVAAAKAALATALAAPAQAQAATPAQAQAPVTTKGSPVAPQAYAKSSNNFEGPYVGLFADLKSTTVKVAGTAGINSASLDGVGQQSLNGHIEGGYGWTTGERIITTVGATYDLRSTTLFNLNFSSTQGTVGAATVKQTDAYSLFIAPGYETSENTLVYAKLAYHHSNVESLAAGTNSNGNKTQINNFGVSGFGYGLGIKTMLTKQLWFSVEAIRVDYNKISIVSGSNGTTGTTIGSMGLGYKFY